MQKLIQKEESKIKKLKELESEIFKEGKRIFISDFRLFDLLWQYHNLMLKYKFHSSSVVFIRKFARLDKGESYFSQLFALFRLYTKEVESYLKEATFEMVKKSGRPAGLTIHKAMILAQRSDTPEQLLKLLKQCHTSIPPWSSDICRQVKFNNKSKSRGYSIRLYYLYSEFKNTLNHLDTSNLTLKRRAGIVDMLKKIEICCQTKINEIIKQNKKEFDEMIR